MNEQLLDYLNGAIELEKEIYVQSKLLNALNYEISKLGKKRKIYKKVAKKTSLGEIAPVSFVICAVVGAALAALITLFFLPSRNFLTRLGNAFGAAIEFGLIGAAFSIIPTFIVYFSGTHKEAATNETYEKKYQSEVEKDNQRVAREKQQAARLRKLYQALYSKYAESSTFLSNYYDAGVLYPKYRNMVACASFYEYLKSGRCSGLEGHGGAYDTYETEAKLDKLLTGMNQILNNLEHIRENQMVLYDTIQEGNRTSARLLKQSVAQSKKLTELSDQCDLIAYNGECTLAEARWGNFLATYRAMN